MLIYLIFIGKMDLKVSGGLSVSNTNLLNIVKEYKSCGWHREVELFSLRELICCNLILYNMKSASGILQWFFSFYHLIEWHYSCSNLTKVMVFINKMIILTFSRIFKWYWSLFVMIFSFQDLLKDPYVSHCLYLALRWWPKDWKLKVI